MTSIVYDLLSLSFPYWTKTDMSDLDKPYRGTKDIYLVGVSDMASFFTIDEQV